MSFSPVLSAFSARSSNSDAVVLPVVYSTFDPNALKILISDHYAISPPLTCRLWHRGLSDIYLIETELASYILRISHKHWRNREDIAFELAFMAFLKQQNLPVAAPLLSKNGRYAIALQAPEGERYASLFPYAEGEVAIGDFNVMQSHRLGKILARIHQASHQFQPPAGRSPLDLPYLLHHSLQWIEPFIAPRSSDRQELLGTIAEIEQAVSPLPTIAPYWTICWGDPHSGNVHFTDDNQPTLFDFDQCGYGWRVFDLAKFLQVSLQAGLNRTVRDALIAGYQSIERLTEIELNCLQPLTQAAYIWSWSIHINSLSRNDHSRLSERYFSQRLDGLRHLRSQDWQLF